MFLEDKITQIEHSHSLSDDARTIYEDLNTFLDSGEEVLPIDIAQEEVDFRALPSDLAQLKPWLLKAAYNLAKAISEENLDPWKIKTIIDQQFKPCVIKFVKIKHGETHSYQPGEIFHASIYLFDYLSSKGLINFNLSEIRKNIPLFSKTLLETSLDKTSITDIFTTIQYIFFEAQNYADSLIECHPSKKLIKQEVAKIERLPRYNRSRELKKKLKDGDLFIKLHKQIFRDVIEPLRETIDYLENIEKDPESAQSLREKTDTLEKNIKRALGHADEQSEWHPGTLARTQAISDETGEEITYRSLQDQYGDMPNPDSKTGIRTFPEDNFRRQFNQNPDKAISKAIAKELFKGIDPTKPEEQKANMTFLGFAKNIGKGIIEGITAFFSLGTVYAAKAAITPKYALRENRSLFFGKERSSEEMIWDACIETRQMIRIK